MLPSTMRRSALLQRTSLNRFAIAGRHFQTSPRQLASKEDILDKDRINTESREYSKTGGDSAAAATEDAAFSADKTRPEEEHAAASRQSGGAQEANNPLNVSPANQEVSQPKGAQRGHVTEGSTGETGQGSERARTSGGGSPAKAGGGKSGGGGAGTS
ncbi:hypothetical protein M409DRAFT_30248 [Zasmidium cellare ATCC 36951]|uniref:Uncharacterized protein n=1 Tax=Zasmidium cellare ATCC 36951 TaxID=1080233 RepID=A0A6A6C0A2_ZASCE|nr:uncharacterized protein M409DRAFT_30248 [Zasmidium cellare ATCC 36951]KAF2159242.1 hypothetical protein M409DRAFT_30248 [Zasmidium cellare ATCC 36951]